MAQRSPDSPHLVDAGTLKLGGTDRFALRLDLGDGVILHLSRGCCSSPKEPSGSMCTGSRSKCADPSMDSTRSPVSHRTTDIPPFADRSCKWGGVTEVFRMIQG